VLTGEVDGSAELEERVTQALRELDLAEEPEHDNENPSDTEPELPLPSQAPKRKIFTQEHRDTAATKDTEKHVAAWRQTHACNCEEADCLLQFDQDILFREMVVFRKMTEVELATMLRSILGVLATAPGVINTVSARRRKKSKAAADQQVWRGSLVPEDSKRMAIAYAFHGRAICAMAFSAIFQAGHRTIWTLAQDVCREYEPPQPRKASHAGTLSAQTTIAIKFIRGMAQRHAMQQPSARGCASKGGKPYLFFMSHNSKMVLYCKYKQQFPDLVQAAIDTGSIAGAVPATPLQPVSFLHLWTRYCSEVRVFKSGSDFCDVCTAYRNKLEPTEEETANFKRHVDGYREERQVYAAGRQTALQEGARAAFIGLIFDFAGKFLLHCLRACSGFRC